MPLHKIIILIILWSCLSSCGYHLAGMGNSLPPHIQKICVPVFKNRSYEYGLEGILTQEVIQSLDRRSGIEVVKTVAEADAVLDGDIVEYKYTPTLNAQRKVTQYYINIRAEVRLQDLVKKEIYWENKNFVFHEVYNVTGGLATIQSNRQQAWQDAAKGFAESLASVLLEGF